MPVTRLSGCATFDALVTEVDAGRDVHVGGETNRFSVCLDERRHPLRRLSTVGCPFGQVSNLSLAGPDSYPIGFQVIRAGWCTVRDGDYSVRIVASP